jgi:hypothetical protein
VLLQLLNDYIGEGGDLEAGGRKGKWAERVRRGIGERWGHLDMVVVVVESNDKITVLERFGVVME